MADSSDRSNKNLILGIAAVAGGAFLLFGDQLGIGSGSGGGSGNGGGNGNGGGSTEPENPPHQVGDDPYNPTPDPSLGDSTDYITIAGEHYQLGQVGGFALGAYLALLRERGVQRQACEEKAATIRSILEEGGACDYKHHNQQCPSEATFFELGSRDDSPFFVGFNLRTMLYDAINFVTWEPDDASSGYVPEIMHNSDWQWIVEHKYEATLPKWGNPNATLRSVVNTMLTRFNNTDWDRSTARTSFNNAISGAIRCGATGAHWRDNGFLDSLGWDGNDLCYCNGNRCFEHIKGVLMYLWDVGEASHNPYHYYDQRVQRGRALWETNYGLCYTYGSSPECTQFRDDTIEYCRNLEIDNMDTWREYIHNRIVQNGGAGDGELPPHEPGNV